MWENFSILATFPFFSEFRVLRMLVQNYSAFDSLPRVQFVVNQNIL